MASTPTAYPQVPAPKNPAPHFVEPTQPRPPTVPYRRTNLPPQIKQPHKQSKAAPSICVAILTMVMICATALLGRPSLHTEGAFSWFPADGYHSRLAQSANSDIWTLEWTRPSLYGLGYSAFVALRPWYENAETSWITDQYARLHTMQTGSDGIANRLVDTLWRLDTAGAKAEVE
ncbi:MAG: hypothetical protein FWG47_07285, partial [Propionibacteriaceae bacterium]|nr:hypothetical protein [Propionibacteriaceae bacterium]